MQTLPTVNDGSPKQTAAMASTQNDNIIGLSIVAGIDQSTSSATPSGSLSHIITSAEASAFGIGSESAIQNAVNAFAGGSCTDAWIQNPTGQFNLYNTFGWQQVTAYYTPKNAVVTTVDATPVAESNTLYQNGSSVVVQVNVSLKYEAEDTAASSWNNPQNFEVGQAVNYAVSILGAGGLGATNFSFNGSFGTGGSGDDTVLISSGNGMIVPLPAESQFSAWLAFQQVMLTVEVTYEVSLSGMVTANYTSPYNGHHFWGYDVNQCLTAANMTTTFQVKQTITLDFYTQGTIQIGKIVPYSPNVPEGVIVVNAAAR